MNKIKLNIFRKRQALNEILFRIDEGIEQKQLGKVDELIKEARKIVLKKKPQDWPILLTNIGLKFYQHKKYKKAIATYEEVNTFSENPITYENLGDLYLEIGESRKAYDNYFKAYHLLINGFDVRNWKVKIGKKEGVLRISFQNVKDISINEYLAKRIKDKIKML